MEGGCSLPFNTMMRNSIVVIQLVAKGKINGKDVEVICETIDHEWTFLFNGSEDAELEEQLCNLMDGMHRVGNYKPKTKKLALWGILDSGVFFDREFPRDVKVFGRLEHVPYSGDYVY